MLLDGVDPILDPLTPKSKEIFAAIEELGSYEHVCLVTTSRMNPEIHGFHRVEVPALSEGGARDIFYNLCKLSRSSAMDKLIARLDFHPLSIELLASCVHENSWDEATLLKAWDDDQMGVLRASYHQRLGDMIGPVLQLPTMKRLGNTAREMLEVIAASPSGIEERELDRGIAARREAVGVLWKYSLVHYQDGFVRMPFPIRCYFLREETIFCSGGPMPGECMSFSSVPTHSHGDVF